jgi:hypothetical protein
MMRYGASDETQSPGSRWARMSVASRIGGVETLRKFALAVLQVHEGER